jgi:hypothetical protein
MFFSRNVTAFRGVEEIGDGLPLRREHEAGCPI